MTTLKKRKKETIKDNNNAYDDSYTSVPCSEDDGVEGQGEAGGGGGRGGGGGGEGGGELTNTSCQV